MILWTVTGINLQYEVILLFAGLMVISALYSSVGHGGASGYLALLSISSYGLMNYVWLKQHVWVMNLVVASLAFYHYNRAGFFNRQLTIPFILASIPMAFIGGAMKIDAEIYDILLSITLIWAGYKILRINTEVSTNVVVSRIEAYSWGGGIGLFSGIIGVGGGIFLSPILLLKKWANVKTAAATAAVFIFANSLSGLLGMGVSGQLDLELDLLALFIIAIGVGGYFGALFGSAYADNRIVRRLLCLVLLVAAAKRVTQLIINY